MSGDSIECFNCGHANPSWAQVCRQCGFALRPDGRPSGGPRGMFPTDQASLISIGGTLGAIVLAIGLGLFFSGLIPEVAAEPTSSPTPSTTPLPSISVAPSAVESLAPSVVATPVLPGTITFGTGLNPDTLEVTGAATTFVAGTHWAHSIKMTVPFGVNSVHEEITRIADGKVVQTLENGRVPVTPDATIAGFVARVSTTKLIEGWGKGDFVMRVYRGVDLLAEGHFTLS